MECFEDIVKAWDALAHCLLDALGYVNDSFIELANVADDAQRAVNAAQRAADAHNAERKRWGHPPKKLFARYPEPMAKIRPNARSRIRKRSSQRRA